MISIYFFIILKNWNDIKIKCIWILFNNTVWVEGKAVCKKSVGDSKEYSGGYLEGVWTWDQEYAIK